VGQLWVGLLVGLAAAPHCAGMCGAFPLHLSRTVGRGRPLLRQLLYLAGKTSTYAFLGALAGTLGQLVVQSRLLSSSQNIAAYALGAAMLIFGLMMLNVLPKVRLPAVDAGEPGLFRRIYGHFFRSPSLGASLILGAATGFLPCPITLAMAAAAAVTHSAPLGALTMAGLGLGTVPVLLGIGFSGTLLDTRIRRIGMRGAAAIVIILGVITMLRPTTLLHRALPHGSSCCHSSQR